MFKATAGVAALVAALAVPLLPLSKLGDRLPFLPIA